LTGGLNAQHNTKAVIYRSIDFNHGEAGIKMF